jgi:hypothetical protein
LTCDFGGKNVKNNFGGWQRQWNQSLLPAGFAPSPSTPLETERERLVAQLGRRAEARLYLNGKCNGKDKATATARSKKQMQLQRQLQRKKQVLRLRRRMTTKGKVKGKNKGKGS